MTIPRLLSPNQRRIYSPKIDDANAAVTMSQLSNDFGWTLYDGPAETTPTG